MTGYQYASIIRVTCDELKNELDGVVPVVHYVFRSGYLGDRWSTILCHPEDKVHTDETKFTHPYRDI